MNTYERVIHWARSLPEPWPGVALIVSLIVPWMLLFIIVLFLYTKDNER